ncbi:MAG: SpoIIE family protein phosphatase [Lachnospiraceae bacterium]|nr:SpoIIE family protein phosphatase [Lachnospiraceae bacterium]
MKQTEQIKKGGLEKKVLQAVLITMAVIVILGAAVISLFFHRMKLLLEDSEIKEGDLVSGLSEEAILKLTEDSLVKTVTWASDKADDEFWILKHDFLVLGEQVKDVLRNPGHYSVLPVEEPRPENQGKYALQLLMPEGFDRNDENMRKIMGRLANLGPMMEEIVRGNDGYTFDCYISMPNGVTLAMDDLSGRKFENGKIRAYDPRVRPWYKGAVEKGEIYFSVPVMGYFYDHEEIVFGVPLYENGELIAVLEGATRIEALQKKLSERNIGESGFSVLINEKGQLIYSPRKKGELAIKEEPYDVRTGTGPDLSEAIDSALAGNTGFSEITLDGEKYYAAYSPFPSFGWAQVMFISTEELKTPSRKLVADMNRISDELTASYKRLIRYTVVILLIVLAVIMLIAQFFIVFSLRKALHPLNLVTEKIGNITGPDSLLEMDDAFRTGDEIQLLAETITGYSERSEAYLKKIVQITSEKERAEAEMEAAAKIQNAMLPKVTGPLYDMKEFEIYGKMIPAKNVGGDLYDYFMIDDDHLAIVIGDVSGKGIPAALFMVLVMNTIRSYLPGDSADLGRAVSRINSFLIDENVGSMFVTLWIGILCLSDGVLKFVNAGHCLAAMSKDGGPFSINKDAHSMIAGVMDKAVYKVNEIKLEAGDAIYLYTDGVTEAHDEAGKLFGEERLLQALNEEPSLSPAQIDEGVRSRIREFMKDTDLFDDLTTLCLRFNG